ncbi:MAG TPA: GDSL-type esterase/lipase family protein [Acidimicrobiales bacterium]
MLSHLLFEVRRRKAYASQVARFRANPVKAGDIVFLGDSITQSGAWAAYFPGLPIRNYGVSGDRTKGVIRRLDLVLHRPAKVFLMIGTNDLGSGATDGTVLDNIETILTRISEASSDTKIYLQSILPRTWEYVDQIQRVNSEMAALAPRLDVAYVELAPLFADDDGVIRPEYCEDGLHLLPPGYDVWVEAIRPLVL